MNNSHPFYITNHLGGFVGLFSAVSILKVHEYGWV